MRRTAALPAAAGLLAGAALLAGCGGGSGDSAAPRLGPPPPGVTALATQTRPDEAAGDRFQVKVSNDGAVPVTVSGVQLRSPGFAPAPVTTREEVFPPGIAYDLPAPYGSPVCDRPVAPLEVLLRLREGGTTRDVVAPLAEDDGLMGRIHDTECRQRALARQVQVQLDPRLVPVPGTSGADLELGGVLHVRRGTTQEPVTVPSTRGNVLYDLLAPQLPAVLAAGSASLDVPVQFGMTSCDQHLLAEVKKPYDFTVFVAVGTAGPLAVPLATDQAQRTRLQAFVAEACTQVTSFH